MGIEIASQGCSRQLPSCGSSSVLFKDVCGLSTQDRNDTSCSKGVKDSFPSNERRSSVWGGRGKGGCREGLVCPFFLPLKARVTVFVLMLPRERLACWKRVILYRPDTGWPNLLLLI